MPDFQLIAENGCALEEDAINEQVIVREGARAVFELTAADVLDDEHIGQLITNTGAAGAASARAITLPDPGAGGRVIRFADVGPGIRIVAPSAKYIRLGGTLSVAAGYIETAYPLLFELWSVDADTWMVRGPSDAFEIENS